MNTVKITADGYVGQSIKVTIGDEVIPVYSVDIHLAVDEITTATIKVPVELVDVMALEEHITFEKSYDTERVKFITDEEGHVIPKEEDR